MSEDGPEKIIGFAMLLMVGRACWVWGWRVWEWHKERERRERQRVWIVAERKVRRESSVVGILKGERWRREGVVKRVSFENGRPEERTVGTVKGKLVGDGMESAVRNVVAASEKLLPGAGMIELLASNGARS